MKFARLIVCSLALLLLAAPGPQTGGFGFGGNPRPSTVSASYAFFEFAPSDGAGMGTACAGTVPTGASGQVLTYTRATTATCLKGNMTSSIANGDLVDLSSGQPAIRPCNVDGTGSLCALIEPQRTNSTLRDRELDNAAWTAGNVGSSTPTVTANYATSPDGTQNAERIQFPDTTAGGISYVTQVNGCTASSTNSGSMFLKGTSTSGTISLMVYGVVGQAATRCSYNETSWTRCERPNTAITTSPQLILISGNGSGGITAGTAEAARDVLAYGGQCEVGATVTSLIHTVGTAVTRNAPDLSFAVDSTSVASAGSAAVSITPLGAVPTTGTGVVMVSAGRPIYTSTTVRIYDGTNDIALSGGFVVGTQKRYRSTWSVADGLDIFNVTDTTTAGGAFDGTMGTSASALAVCGNTGIVGVSSSWLCGRVCLSPSTTGCN